MHRFITLRPSDIAHWGLESICDRRRAHARATAASALHAQENVPAAYSTLRSLILYSNAFPFCNLIEPSAYLAHTSVPRAASHENKYGNSRFPAGIGLTRCWLLTGLHNKQPDPCRGHRFDRRGSSDQGAVAQPPAQHRLARDRRAGMGAAMGGSLQKTCRMSCRPDVTICLPPSPNGFSPLQLWSNGRDTTEQPPRARQRQRQRTSRAAVPCGGSQWQYPALSAVV